MRRFVLALLASWLLIPGWFAPAVAAESPITVFAAASLTDVIQELATAYTKSSGTEVKMSFAASSALARQIEAGARADVFVSADQEWMDYLDQRGLIDPTTRRNLVGNRLVLIAPANSDIALKIAKDFPLAAALGKGRLATGDPDLVPVGRYARSALVSLGVWSQIADRLVRADNVRSALAFVSRGEVPLGIVYETDALADSKVRIVDYFPDNTHLPITYPAALIKAASPGAAGFLQFLQGADAAEAFKKYGFKNLR